MGMKYSYIEYMRDFVWNGSDQWMTIILYAFHDIYKKNPQIQNEYIWNVNEKKLNHTYHAIINLFRQVFLIPASLDGKYTFLEWNRKIYFTLYLYTYIYKGLADIFPLPFPPFSFPFFFFFSLPFSFSPFLFCKVNYICRFHS